jgi:hypothetical protein
MKNDTVAVFIVLSSFKVIVLRKFFTFRIFLLLAERPSCLVARIPSCVVVIRESTFVPFTKRALSPSFPLAIESLWLCKK